MQPYSEVNPDLCGVWLRLAPTGNTIEYEIVSFIVERRQSSDAATSDAPTLRRERGELLFHLAPYASDQAWLKSWTAWATPTQELHERFSSQRPAPRNDRPEPSLRKALASRSSALMFVNGADALEWLAWATRTPIIADAFRTDVVVISAEELSPRYALDRLAMHGWLRLDQSGYLLRRTQSYLSLRAVEIPEDALRPLERKFQKGQWLTAEDYVALAARLNDTQADAYEQGFGANRYARSAETLHGRTVTVEFPFETLAMNMRAWRFLAALSPAQRRQALTGEWQSAAQLTLLQRTRFLQALEERFPPPESLFAEVPTAYTFYSDDELYFEGIAAGRRNTELTPVSAPAFQLREKPETPQYLEVEVEYGTRYFHLHAYAQERLQANHPDGLPPEASQKLRQALSESELRALQRTLESNPNAAVRVRLTQGYVLEMQAPPNRQRRYYLLQQQSKPVTRQEGERLVAGEAM